MGGPEPASVFRSHSNDRDREDSTGAGHSICYREQNWFNCRKQVIQGI